jgi:hypothetical protein
MPTVGGVKFPYTKQGMAKAKAWSQMTGKPIKIEDKYKQGGKLKPLDSKKNPGLSKLPPKVRNKMGYMQEGGKISEEEMLRLMFALGGEIPEGRRMYGMSKKKKPVMQTSTAGMPVRGMKKGGKVKYHV